MLIKKIFRGIGLLLKASIGLALVLSILGFIYLFSTGNAASELFIFFLLGILSIAGIIKGLIVFFDWLGQPSKDDEDD